MLLEDTFERLALSWINCFLLTLAIDDFEEDDENRLLKLLHGAGELSFFFCGCIWQP